MQKLFVTICALATLASCQKESSIDMALTQNNQIKFAPYAGASNARGTAVNNNGDLKGNSTDGWGSFKVAACLGDETYFGFTGVTYNGTDWANDGSMYWPNVDGIIHFGAYYPSSATMTNAAYTYSGSDHNLSFDYSVEDHVANQVDVMYAISDYDYTVPRVDVDPSKANIHFKHALTQIAFKATKADDIKVSVESIKICNVVKDGTFTATKATNFDGNGDLIGGDQNNSVVNKDNFGVWTDLQKKTYVHYDAVMASASPIELTTGQATALTDASDAMMLRPQVLKKWDAEVAANNTGTESYLAIKCKITHLDGEAAIIDGTVFVPFDTSNIPYEAGNPEDGWKPGYIVTYVLNFGGGYTIPDNPDPEIPTPGTTPDPEEVIPTLRTITYDVSVDEWIPVDGSIEI